MRAVIQRVASASVIVKNNLVGQIDNGLLILLGIESDDEKEDVEYLVNKTSQMRIFPDNDDKMNLNVEQVNGNCLVVSQFTLHASTKKGNRPSFIKAARPEIALPLYHNFIESLSKSLNKKVESGEFGAMMQIELVNDGPVTLLIDSKNKE
jgi:D-tyrosyl-tRNA(Tyr) deacylase